MSPLLNVEMTHAEPVLKTERWSKTQGVGWREEISILIECKKIKS